MGATKKIVLMKGRASQPAHAAERREFGKTLTMGSAGRRTYEEDRPVNVVRLRQVSEVSDFAKLPLQHTTISPEPRRRMSPSISSAVQSSRSQHEADQKKEAELVDYLLNELSAVESELGGERKSPKAGLAVELAARTPRTDFFRSVINSPAFSSDKEREEYLIKEVENANKKIGILECETQLLRKENGELRKMLSANIHEEETKPMHKGSCCSSTFAENRTASPAGKGDPQSECAQLRRENLKLQEELLLRSSDVYQLILRTAKVNYRMQMTNAPGKEPAGNEPGGTAMRKDRSMPSIIEGSSRACRLKT